MIFVSEQIDTSERGMDSDNFYGILKVKLMSPTDTDCEAVPDIV